MFHKKTSHTYREKEREIERERGERDKNTTSNPKASSILINQ